MVWTKYYRNRDKGETAQGLGDGGGGMTPGDERFSENVTLEPA